jgi:hypothetical protein
MTLGVLATVLLVVVLVMTLRARNWLQTAMAVLLGIAATLVGGAMSTAGAGVLATARSALSTLSATLF